MISKELSEAAVELECVLENSSPEILRQIPENFINFINKIKSKTYHFEFDKSKSLKEQNLKPETRGLIALIYQDYLCNEKEKQEYIEKSNEFLRLEEEKKRELYNPDNIFNDNKTEIKNTKKNELIISKKESFIQKIIDFLRGLVKK